MTWQTKGLIGFIMTPTSDFLRQEKPTDFPWGNIHFELWIRSQQFSRTNNMPPNAFCSPWGSTYVPIG